MNDYAESIKALGQAILFSFFLFLFGRMFYAVSSMRGLAKKTWQKALTEFITAFLGILGVGAIMIIWTGV